MSKFEEIKNKAKEKVAEVAEQAKNYDYKGKAEEIKTRATDIADKAKEYDYKAKAEEIKEAVTSYDYKEKAKEVKEAVKGFDYEGKAKEVADTVKNYDYKAEAENIKKGGLKYFWNNHRKLSIIVVAIILVLVVATKFTGGGITEKSNGYKCFSMTKTDFTQKYNEAYYELSGSDMYNPSKYPHLDEERCKAYEPYATDVEVYPNMKILYEYDTTLYSGYGQSQNSSLAISTDEKENIVHVSVARGSSALGTDKALDAFFNTDCAAALSSLTGKSYSEASKLINEVTAGGIKKEHGYEYFFNSENGKTTFIIRVAD